MASHVYLDIRAVFRFLGVCFWLIPTLAIAVRGGVFVYDCVVALTSSDTPAILRLQTPGGIITLKAGSFQFDLDKNVLHASKVVLFEPDGSRSVAIDELRLFDVVPGKKTITGYARGVTGKLQRGADSSWRFLDYLPNQEGEASDIAFSVVIKDLSLKIDDLANKEKFSRWVSSEELHMDGVGDDLVVTGPVKIQGSGTTQLSFRKQKGGIYVSGDGQMELMPIIAWLRGAPEGKDVPWLKDFSADRLTARGPWTVTYVNDKLGLRVPGRATFVRLAYGEYRADTGEIQGTLTETGFDGFADVRSGGSRARFEGAMRWADKFDVAGRIEGMVPSVASLPPSIRKALPKGVAFTNGDFTGWLSYRDDFSFIGDAQLAALRYQGEEFRNIKAKLDVNPIAANVGISQATYLGQPLTGAVRVVNKSSTLDGFVKSPRVLLEPVLRKFGLTGIQGQGVMTATLTGTIDKPLVQFEANGNATSTLSGSRLDLGIFNVRGSYAGNTVQLAQSGVKGPSGSAYATGTIDLQNSKLNLDVLASDFPLEALSTQIAGQASFRGVVRGSLSSPFAEGGAEVYNLKAADQELPVAFADVRVDKEKLTASNLTALRGGSRIQGDAGIRWKDQSLFGSLSAFGIQANDWFPDQIAGVLDVTNGILGGTLNSPTLSAELTGNTLVTPALKVDSIGASIKYLDGTVFVSNGKATVGGGSVTASGQMALESRSGTFAVQAKDLPLGRLLFDAAKTLNVSGNLTTNATVTLDQGELKGVDSKGQVSDLALNDTVIGSGEVNANYAGGVLSGNALIGQLDSYVEISQFSLNPSTEQLDANFTLNNEPLSKLVAFAERYGGESIPQSLRDQLGRLEGELDFSGTTSGKWTNPILEGKAFSLTNLKVDEVDQGALTAQFGRVDGLWTLSSFNWNGPLIKRFGDGAQRPNPSSATAAALSAAPAAFPFSGAITLAAAAAQQQQDDETIQFVFNAKGTIDEHGDTHLTGSLNNLLARSLAIFAPGISNLQGVFDMPQFTVNGPTRAPIIEAGLGYRESAEDGKSTNTAIDVTATVTDGKIEASGLYQLSGFTGPIEAIIPFRYPFEIAKEGDIFAKIALPERRLVDLSDLWPSLDPALTKGAVQGELTVTGKPDALKFLGSAKLFPGPDNTIQVADKSFGTYLKNLDASILFNGERISLTAGGESSDTGTFAIKDAGIGLGDVFDAILAGRTEDFFRNAISGRVEFDRFRVAYNDKTAGQISGTMSGGIDLSGSVGAPGIGGELILDEGNLALPTLEGTGETSSFAINPTFNINVRTGNAVRFRAAAGTFDLTGSGSLNGSLESPNLQARLITQGGSIRLPNARIAIEEGGEIVVSYQPSPSGIVASRADLNLEGRTQVSAESISGGVERYDILITIRGNLLADGGLILTARSDPPDLSQDRILALLGQGDFLRSININALSPTEQIRSALVGLALPYLAGSLTDKIASTLGLDYINVEYSAFDKITVTAAISITRDLVLSGRRQISNPAPGQRPKFDIRLSYRPRFAGKSFSRISFNIGADQDRPWKIGVEYAIKY